MALPPMKENGSTWDGMASNSRHRNENVMMENMSLPTPNFALGSQSRSRSRSQPAGSPTRPSASPSAAIAPEDSPIGFWARSLHDSPMRFASNNSRPNDSSGITAKPMRLVWSLDMPATRAVTMAAAGEAIVAKNVAWRAKRSPHSTWSGPAPRPPTTNPTTMSGSLPIQSAKGMMMPLAARATGVNRNSATRTVPSRFPLRFTTNDTASALKAPNSR